METKYRITGNKGQIHHSFKEGEIVTVEEYNATYVNSDGKSQFVCPEDLEVVTEPEAPVFKGISPIVVEMFGIVASKFSGLEVVILNNTSTVRSGYSAGTVGVIQGVDGDGDYWVLTPGTGEAQCFASSSISLFEHPQELTD